MDILTHLFIPLIGVYVAGMDGVKSPYLFLLSFFAILPDFDVFLGVHRGLFHSLIFLIPLSASILLAEYLMKNRIKYSVLTVFFLFSHIFLDFLSGGVPFLYPLIDTGLGVEFPFVIEFGSSVTVTEFLPKFVYFTPESVHGRSFDAFSGFGVMSLILFAVVYWRDRNG
jgi:membrane-bound metal-dependent hydrolase YbcI (DUF457 family)